MLLLLLGCSARLLPCKYPIPSHSFFGYVFTVLGTAKWKLFHRFQYSWNLEWKKMESLNLFALWNVTVKQSWNLGRYFGWKNTLPFFCEVGTRLKITHFLPFRSILLGQCYAYHFNQQKFRWSRHYFCFTKHDFAKFDFHSPVGRREKKPGIELNLSSRRDVCKCLIARSSQATFKYNP